ncbi:MAG: SMP-30/gluconolactonase/LRE family protein [Spirochaetes bacterium]|nr:SMP-30/gluconolactonase/LRE family protein [Spirochaetota bacterium]
MKLLTATKTAAKTGALLIALSMLILPGCGSKTDSGLLGALFLSGGDDKSGSALISAASGGVVQLNDEVTLTVPPYSIADDTTITIERVRDIPGGDAGSLSAFGQAYRFLPRGTEFDMAAPAVLEMNYDSAALDRLGFDPGTMQICYFDEDLESYVPVNCAVDTARRKITAYIEHFTVYLPMAKALLPTNNDPYVGVQAPWPNPIRAGAPIYIRATVTDFDGSIAGVTLRYRKLHGAGAGVWHTARMTKEVNPQATLHTYGHLVPADFLPASDIGDGNDIEYRIEAVDNLASVRNSVVRRYDVTLSYQEGSLSLNPAAVDIAVGFQRLMSPRGVDSNDAVFTLVPEMSVMAEGSCLLENRYARGILLKAVTQTTPGTPDELTVGFGSESATASINVHAGEIESIEILNNCGLPIGHTIYMTEGTVYSFDVVGRDGYGNAIPVLPVWTADPSIGIIDPDGVLDTTGCQGPGVITASLSYLSDTQNVYVYSRAKDITAFSINGIDGEIAYPFITVTLPWGTDVTGLVASFSTTGTSVTVDGDAQDSGVTANDFTDPVVYRVTAENGSTQDYTVQVRMLSPYKDITAFSINGIPGVISDTNITVRQPIGTDVTSLVAEFSTTGQSVAVGGVTQASGVTANDFTDTVIYTVTAMDGSTKNYSVAVQQFLGLVSHFAGSVGGYGDTNGIGQEARFWNPRGIASDGTSLYVADSYNYSIRKLDIATGEVTTFAGSPGNVGNSDGIGSNARFSNLGGIVCDGSNLYVASTGNQTIRKIVIATREVTTIAGLAYTYGSADGVGQSARFNNPNGITYDGTNLYVADTGNSTIRKIVINTGEVTTIAGLAGTVGSADGTGQNALFRNPLDITYDGINLYVADTNNFTIRKIDLSSGQVTTVAGLAGTSGIADGIGQNARFQFIYGIMADGINIYVASGSVIRKIVISTMQVSTIAGMNNTTGSLDGIGQSAQFYSPSGLCKQGNVLFVADSGNNTIRRFDLDTAEVTTIAGLAGSTGSTDAVGLDARFYYPNGITSDGSYLYVTQTYTIRRIDMSTGMTTTIAGLHGAAGSTDGIGQNARFSNPSGIAFDGVNLFVTDSNSIRKIVISTGEVTTLAGVAGSAGSTDATGLNARFSNPLALTVVGSDLYVADTGNNTIRRIVLASGEVTTLAGLAGTSGSTNGTGQNARFYTPCGLTNDGANLFVTDLSNQTIRKIVINTAEVTTLAGLAGFYGSTDGIGQAARFRSPYGIATDGMNLYVTEQENFTVRRIQIATNEVTTIAGLARNRGSADGYGSAASFNNPRGIVYVDFELYVADRSNSCIRKIE